MNISRVDISQDGASTLTEVIEFRKRGGKFSVNWRSELDLSVPLYCVTSLASPFFTNRLLAVATVGAQSIYTCGHQVVIPETETLDQREDLIFKMIAPFWPSLCVQMNAEYDAIRRRLAWRYSLARAMVVKASRSGVDVRSSAVLEKIKERQSQFEEWL